MCVRTTGTSQKFAIFDQKICFQIKISVPFVRCTSYGETTMYITCFKSIYFTVLNIEAILCSLIAELYFEFVQKRALFCTNPPKKKSRPLTDKGRRYLPFLWKLWTKF